MVSLRVGRRRLLVVFLILTVVSLHCHIKLWQQQESNIDAQHSLMMKTFLDASKGQIKNKNISTRGPVRKWAYAFLIGGCSSQKPEYHGFLYNVLVAAQRLQDLGSTADVVLMIQMSATTNELKLPPHEEKMLKDIGIKIKYLPKFSSEIHEVFYALVMEKFRILELTEYSRVLFLDGDIMPLCSMDYLFDLSEPETGDPILKENVILSWKSDASNAGLFMLKPSLVDYIRIQQIIHAREVKAVSLPYPHWDEVQGWGHKIEPPDHWRSANGKNGTNWTWFAAFADQGLLYHWTKYEKGSVSIIIGCDVENWASNVNGTLFLEHTLEKGLLNRYSCRPRKKGRETMGPYSPYTDFMHFTGRAKPWQNQSLALSFSSSLEDGAKNTTAHHDERYLPKFHPQKYSDGSIVWYQTLRKVSEIYKVKIDFGFTKVDNNTIPTVGGKPPANREVASSHKQIIKHLLAKNQTAWSQYAS